MHSIGSHSILFALAIAGGLSCLAILVYWFNRRQQTRKINEQLKHDNTKLNAENQLVKCSLDSLRTELDLLYKKQHKAEKQSSMSLDFYRNVFDLSPAFYIALNETLDINDINLIACERLKYSFSELMGLRFIDLIEPSERHRISGMLDQVQNGVAESCRIDTVLLDYKQQAIHVVLHIHRIQRHRHEALLVFCEDVSESRELSQAIAYQAHHDELTNLKNRRALENYFAEELHQYGEYRQLALVYFDIDQLKVVNDTCGHIAGDQLIKQMVATLRPTIEKEGTVFARIGGDEFVTVLLNRNAEQVDDFAELLRTQTEAFVFRWDGLSFRQSISIGIATSISSKDTLGSLLSAADAACYGAKESGRNRIQLCPTGINQLGSEQHQSMFWVSRLDQAIHNDNFVLNFQPIVTINKPYAPYIHYEVLLQYRDEHGELVQPQHFLPSAERFGKSTAIDLWVLKATFDYLRLNKEHARRLGCCSINLTSHSIASERSRATIIAMVRASDFPAHKICFEITESSAMQNLGEAIDFMRTLRALGCRFALDDFGTGFSSFSYLKNLEVDYLKIDGSFVKDVARDKIARAMIKAICTIAKEMGIATIAEYVENDVIMRELKTLGVDYGQGFGIAKPMPINALDEFYVPSLKAVSL